MPTVLKEDDESSATNAETAQQLIDTFRGQDALRPNLYMNEDGWIDPAWDFMDQAHQFVEDTLFVECASDLPETILHQAGIDSTVNDMMRKLGIRKPDDQYQFRKRIATIVIAREMQKIFASQ